ncbi:MAG: serine protease [Candidatus Liptonbacteria bacterium]|nr:serine protease [Candidatus Liptonbacteria bacterium]
MIKTNDGYGTGIIIGENLVLICNHLLDKDSGVTVNDESASVLKVDEKNDLALLYLRTGYIAPIKFAKIALQDDPIFYVGNPLGHVKLISHGRICDIDEGMIFTDARIFPGASGSGAYNDKGELIGIVTGMQGRDGLGMTFGVITPFPQILAFLSEEPKPPAFKGQLEMPTLISP